ncbi:MAG TPA: lysylphosphatidylglycerol synthase transmembrane domain-containing protein [Gaiellaceae bacterium]|nr:lysylphosphatidylglycerol synthase transmembrane domain-containing protein [Gaiellaceae bacterium]
MTLARAVWRSGWVQAGVGLTLFAAALAVIWWRGPEWDLVLGAFRLVAWSWILVALLLNVASSLARAFSWRLTLGQALPQDRQPRLLHVLSAFGVGLFANAVVPGRLGELARVATLRRHLPGAPSGTSAALVGTVFVHRLFDLVPASLLVVWVLLTARVPHWAVVVLLVAAAVGFALFAAAWLGARRRQRPVVREGVGTVRHLLAMARQGLTVLKEPLPLAGAVVLQCLGWLLQLLAVYAAMQAFGIDAPLPAAGLVLVLMNVVTIVPLWPGNVGLTQAAVALPLLDYGVAYGTGFAYGLALQAVEMACGTGLGVLALAREGLSVAMLRRLEEEPVAEAETGAGEGGGKEVAPEGAALPR